LQIELFSALGEKLTLDGLARKGSPLYFGLKILELKVKTLSLRSKLGECLFAFGDTRLN
jgi:hypothetical protein